MSDNFNIEELFRSNLSSLEADVSPNAWTNIQQGLNGSTGVTAASGGTGLSFIAKSIIVSTGIVAATIAGVYLYNNDQPQDNANQAIVTVDDTKLLTNEQTKPITDPINSGPTVGDNNGGDNETELGESLAPVSQPIDLYDPMDSHDQLEAGSAGEIGQGNNGGVEADNNTQGNGGNGSEGENSGQESTELEKHDNTREEREPVQKQISANPSFTVLTNNNEAPATYAFVSNAENCSKVRWDFGDGTTAEGFEVEHTYEKPGTYKVEMNCFEGNQGHLEGFTVIVESISKITHVPNIISPDGDHRNDFFFIGSEQMEKMSIIIRDNKGNSVFISDDIDFRWYATDMGGNNLPEGTYDWVLIAFGLDGTKFQKAGQITVTR